MKQSPPSYAGSDCGTIPRALATNPLLPYARVIRDKIRHPSANSSSITTHSYRFPPNQWIDMTKSRGEWLRGVREIQNNALRALEGRSVIHFEVRFSPSDRILGWYAVALNAS